LVAKLTNIINNSFGRYFGRRFDTTVIWWLFQLQIATTNFRSLNSVTKLLFPCSAMVITIEIEDFVVKKMLVDHESSVNILYWDTFMKLNLSKYEIQPHYEYVIDFAG